MKVDSAVWEGGYLKLHTADVDARHFAYAFTPGEYEIKPKTYAASTRTLMPGR